MGTKVSCYNKTDSPFLLVFKVYERAEKLRMTFHTMDSTIQIFKYVVNLRVPRLIKLGHAVLTLPIYKLMNT